MEHIMELASNPNAWMALLTLVFLEIVLGIDNIVFLSIVTSKLPKAEQPKARKIGMLLAMVFRIGLLFALGWVMSLTKSFFDFDFGFMAGAISGKSLIVFLGGLFLLYKSVKEIHSKVDNKGEEEKSMSSKAGKGFVMAIVQIVLLDIVFSFDSVLTAVGLVSFNEFGKMGAMIIIIIAIVISVAVMMVFSEPVSRFVNKHLSIQILGLSFLILIGLMLILEAAHSAGIILLGQEVHEVPKGYLYFAIFFSLLVEVLNLKASKKK